MTSRDFGPLPFVTRTSQKGNINYKVTSRIVTLPSTSAPSHPPPRSVTSFMGRSLWCPEIHVEVALVAVKTLAFFPGRVYELQPILPIRLLRCTEDTIVPIHTLVREYISRIRLRNRITRRVVYTKVLTAESV
jgi:hypothetical protein